MGVVAGLAILASAPVIVTTGIIVLAGILLNCTLNVLDEKTGLSNALKEKLRDYIHHHKNYDYGFDSPYFDSF